MLLYSILAGVMVISMALSYFIQGEFGEINIHLAAYGFILAGIGYLIGIFSSREKDLDMKISYMLNKKFAQFNEELKTIRTMLLTLEERRVKPEEKISETELQMLNKDIPASERPTYHIPPVNTNRGES